jgi:hypothetical protein
MRQLPDGLTEALWLDNRSKSIPTLDKKHKLMYNVTQIE